jgi:serine/threonine protein kinase
LNTAIKKFKDGDTFVKIYPLTTLDCSIQKIEFRLSQIKKYIDIGFGFNIDSENLTLKFEYIKSSRPTCISDLNLLGKYLDYIHSKNVFHGDIHYRNLMIKGNKIVLIDWEPCFIQIINNKKIIKSHSKGIANKDRKIKKISPLTDKKGFLKLISEKAFNQLADTPEMENLTCLELLDKFHQPSPYS